MPPRPDRMSGDNLCARRDSAVALHGAGAGGDRDPARQRHRLERRRRSRRDRDRARGANEHSRTAVTNEAGYYIFSSLQNGTYTVDAELQGFKKVVRPNVKVDVNTTVRVDLKLEVGQINETVTVSAETPAAADRPHRHRPHHRVEDGRRSCR